jgi:hypothetical protein
MSDCNDTGCLLNLGARPKLSNPEEVLGDVTKSRVLRATALRQLSATNSVTDMLSYSRTLLVEPDEELRQFARIALYFWLADRNSFPPSPESEAVIQITSSGADVMERGWFQLIRALLLDPNVLEHSKQLIAEGKSQRAWKILGLMRTPEALGLIRDKIWNKDAVSNVSFNAACVLAVNGVNDVSEYFLNAVSTQALDNTLATQATIALAKLGDAESIGRLKSMLDAETLAPDDDLLRWAMRGFSVDFPNLRLRANAWVQTLYAH